jgi:hypothetical protein
MSNVFEHRVHLAASKDGSGPVVGYVAGLPAWSLKAAKENSYHTLLFLASRTAADWLLILAQAKRVCEEEK